jgi:photosystem II stability/assembly factor-like uncharacterized protein
MIKKILISSFFIFSLFFTTGCLQVGDTNKNLTSGPAGVFLSIDKGENWLVRSSLPLVDGVKTLQEVSVFKFIEDPKDENALYWASREKGLFYSYDNALTWMKNKSELSAGFIYDVAVSPEDKCIIFSTNGRQVFKTEDCSRTWEEVYREARLQDNITSIKFNPFNTNQIWMTETNGDLFVSSDLGKNWAVQERFKTYVSGVYFDEFNSGLMYVASKTKGLYRSKDTGQTWLSLADKLKTFSGSLDYRRFLVYPAKAETIYWVSKYGILTSRNAGEDWEAIKLVTPPGSVDIYGFAVNPKNSLEIYYTGTINNKSTFYRSMDGGKNWDTRKLPTKQIPTAIRIHPVNTDWVYMGFTIPEKK